MFQIIFLRPQLLKISFKFIVIWLSYGRKKRVSFIWTLCIYCANVLCSSHWPPTTQAIRNKLTRTHITRQMVVSHYIDTKAHNTAQSNTTHRITLAPSLHAATSTIDDQLRQSTHAQHVRTYGNTLTFTVIKKHTKSADKRDYGSITKSRRVHVHIHVTCYSKIKQRQINIGLFWQFDDGLIPLRAHNIKINRLGCCIPRNRTPTAYGNACWSADHHRLRYERYLPLPTGAIGQLVTRYRYRTQTEMARLHRTHSTTDHNRTRSRLANAVTDSSLMSRVSRTCMHRVHCPARAHSTTVTSMLQYTNIGDWQCCIFCQCWLKRNAAIFSWLVLRCVVSSQLRKPSHF